MEKEVLDYFGRLSSFLFIVGIVFLLLGVSSFFPPGDSSFSFMILQPTRYWFFYGFITIFSCFGWIFCSIKLKHIKNQDDPKTVTKAGALK